jgi:hypothetical protein
MFPSTEWKDVMEVQKKEKERTTRVEELWWHYFSQEVSWSLMLLTPYSSIDGGVSWM